MGSEGGVDEGGFGGRGEGDAEGGADAVADLAGQREQGGGAGGAGVDQGQGVLGGDPGAVAGVVAAGEPGSLDQPGGGHLDLAVPGVEAGDPGLGAAPGAGGGLAR